MAEKYEELYISGGNDKVVKKSAESVAAYRNPPQYSPKIQIVHKPASQDVPDPKRFVRVLWDIENVQVPKRHRAIDLVAKLHKFLADQSPILFGPGIDLRITAFFNPSSNRVPAHVVDELDRAAVELVWVSKKREDADRKIGGDVVVCSMYLDVLYSSNGFLLLLNPGVRINQEMQVLKPPECVTFMLISSDNDFRHHVQLMTNAGYEAIVVHNPGHSAGNDRGERVEELDGGGLGNGLELHATRSIRWSEIVNYNDKASTSPPAIPRAVEAIPVHKLPVPLLEVGPSNVEQGGLVQEEEEEEQEGVGVEGGSGEEVKGGRSRSNGRNGSHRRKNRKPQSRFVEKVRSLHSVAVGDDEVPHTLATEAEREPKEAQKDSAEWRLCVCSRWVGAYGFVLFENLSSPISEAVAPTEGDIQAVRLLLDRRRGKKEEVGQKEEDKVVERVYVHYKVLHHEERCFLKKGDVVLCLVESSER